MKPTSFFSTLVAAALGTTLLANSALADHKHHNHHQHRGHSHQVTRYYEPVRYYESSRHYVRESYHEHGREYGRVISARPIYQRVAVDIPRESCHVQTYARESRRGGDSFAGTVVGGLVGAAIGHEVGNGRGGATAVGGLIGASIGNDASKQRVVSYRDEEVCNTRYRTEYEQQLVGYDVSYSYMGRIYQTRTDRHPGDRLAVDVNIRPGYRN